MIIRRPEPRVQFISLLYAWISHITRQAIIKCLLETSK